MEKRYIGLVRGNSKLIGRIFKDRNKNVLIFNPETDELDFKVRKTIKSTASIEKKLDNGIKENDGIYTINIESKDTENLDYGDYGYSIRLTIGKNEPNPFVIELESGTFSITPYDYARPGGDT